MRSSVRSLILFGLLRLIEFVAGGVAITLASAMSYHGEEGLTNILVAGFKYAVVTELVFYVGSGYIFVSGLPLIFLERRGLWRSSSIAFTNAGVFLIWSLGFLLLLSLQSAAHLQEIIGNGRVDLRSALTSFAEFDYVFVVILFVAVVNFAAPFGLGERRGDA